MDHTYSQKAPFARPMATASLAINEGIGSVGLSGHMNDYRSPGVLINNHVEERFGQDISATGRHLLGQGGEFRGVTTMQATYTDIGKTGIDVVMASERAAGYEGVKGDLLQRHGDFGAPAEPYLSTMNQLTYGENRAHGEPRADTYTWNGHNSHDSKVPLTTVTAMNLTATKVQQWQQQHTDSPYQTTSRSAALAAASVAAVKQDKTATIRQTAEHGTPEQPGRKPKGEHSDVCDKEFRKTGLRGVYYSGNQA